MTRVHIASSAKNAARWLDAFMESLIAQDHADWVLYIRDDGSTDGTGEILDRWREREPRIADVEHDRNSVGSARGFARMLSRVPADAEAIATADADDVWLPHRLETTLAALREAESRFGAATPILVHTDLRIVDAELREVAPSMWRASGMNPEASTITEIAIENVAVGPTLLFNGALLAQVREAPAEAIHQDWWIALVAAAKGTLVPVSEPTVLYRQHGANSAGALLGGKSRLRRAFSGWARRAMVRRQLDETARQAGALVARLGDRLDRDSRESLAGLASVARLTGWERKRAIVSWRWHRRHGVLRNLGVLLRG